MSSKSDPNNTRPPVHPRLVLRIGVLGNRFFGDEAHPPLPGDAREMKAALRGAARGVLATICDAMTAVKSEESQATFRPIGSRWRWTLSKIAGGAFDLQDRWRREDLAGKPAGVFRDEVPLMKIHGGQAEGTDKLLEEVALSLQTRLPAVAVRSVPIVVEEGAMKEGSTAPGEAFSVGRIPAKPTSGNVATRETALEVSRLAQERARGYRAQAEALRHHSDLLIAAWDPAADGKTGGTAETVAMALAENIPVIALRFDAGGRVTVDLLGRPSELVSKTGAVFQEPDLMAEPDPALAEVLRSISAETCRLLAFPDAPPVPELSWRAWCSRWYGKGAARSAHGPHPHKPFTTYDPGVAFHCVRAETDLGTPWPAEVWSRFFQWVGRLPWIERFHARKDKDLELVARHFYRDTRVRVSSVTGVFGKAYRGGVLISYALGATAVVLSVLGVYLHFGGAPVWARCLVGVAEFGVLVHLAILAFASTVEGWHEFYTDTRVLAEALRCMDYLGPLGVHTPIPKLPPYLNGGRDGTLGHDPRRSWSVWYLRALIREAPIQWAGGHDGERIPPARMQRVLAHRWVGSPEATVLDSQVDYHRRTAAAHKVIHEGIEWATRLTFFVVLTAVLVESGALIFEGGEGHAGGHERIGVLDLGTPLQVIGILSPAILGALGGFLAQIGCQRLHQRSESMEQTLLERFHVLEAVDTRRPDSLDANWQLAREAAITAARMVDEAAGWALIYKNSDIHVG